MPTSLSQRKYKDLGDLLLQAFGEDKTQSSLAKQTSVSSGAVHLWLTGRCRPEPHRLGLVCGILELRDPEKLARLAEYTEQADVEGVIASYNRYVARQNGKEGTLVDKREFCEKLIPKIQELLEEKGMLRFEADKRVFEELKPHMLEELMNFEI